MSDMVRKQIYIEKRQQLALQQRARITGQSEAELVRQAIDRELLGTELPNRPDPRAWDQVRQFIHELSARKPVGGEPYQFNRNELYKERLNRYAPNSD
jgi:hypothetical protein